MLIFKVLKTGWMKLGLILLCGWLSIGLSGCGNQTVTESPNAESAAARPRSSRVKVVEPPAILAELAPWFDNNQPQLTILSPRPDEVLQDTSVSVRFKLQDLSIYKDETWGLGPHLHVILDNQPYKPVYDLTTPLIFDALTPGTHTLRVFASRPWHESFKNDGAYAQTTFHVFTKTNEHRPTVGEPLLTYSRPNGTYGAEPIVLDFYLTDAPLHMIAKESGSLTDWRVRYTVNGNSNLLDTWEPIYLTGFKPGRNWVQLELIDPDGNPIPNQFNNTARLITYQPGGDDPLAKLVRGELSLEQVGSVVDPNYVPPKPALETEPTSELESTPESAPTLSDQSVPQPTPLETIPEIKATPEAVKPEPLEPAVAEPEATEPKATEPKATEPEATEPEVTEPETSAPESVVPDIAKPETAESETTELEDAEPEATEPETTEPESGISDTAEPERTITVDQDKSELESKTEQRAHPSFLEETSQNVRDFLQRLSERLKGSAPDKPTVQTVPPLPPTETVQPSEAPINSDATPLEPFIELEQGDFPLEEDQVPDIVDLLEESAQKNALENEPKTPSENALDSEDLLEDKDSLEDEDLLEDEESDANAPKRPPKEPASTATQSNEQSEPDLDDVWQRLRQYRQRSLEAWRDKQGQ
ncbi:MAG: hypothetical protein AAGF01_07575 [Cyanobacteria bacterium P01_G01_bin.38]